MPYEVVENFAGGLDNRKSTLTAPGGTLTRLTNAMITPGGEIAKRRAFVKIADVSSNCFGLATNGASLFVFGRNALPTITLTADGTALAGQTPATIIQRRLVPDATATLQMTDSDIFNGKVYIACSGGTTAGGVSSNAHYYDDENVADADMIRTQGSGKGYSIRSYQSKMYSVIGGYLYFSAIGQPIIWDPATDIAPVTVLSLSDGYPARVTVAVGDIAKFKNGAFVTVSGADALHTKANGFHRISGVATTGTFANSFYLDEVDTTPSTGPQTTGVKVDNAPTTGRGYINLSAQSAGAEAMTGIEVYYNKLALFSNRAVQVWAVDPDPLKNQYEQLLRGVSTTAPQSAFQYGSGDVLFLDSSGVRSLKAKDSSNSASVSDIGSPIDTILGTLKRTIGYTNMNKAISILEPSIGRFWMVFPNEAFVLSDFPGPKITAWSRITLPFTVLHVVSCNGKLFFRDTANQIWVYGGADGVTYENCGVEVRLPYVSGKKPGHNKNFEALDVTAQGTWEARVSYEFGDPESEEVVGALAPTTADPLSASTWNKGRAELTGYSSHISLRFYNNDALPATLSNAAVHYQTADEEQ